MALMERVATLLRANVNDMLDRAEDPEKLARQLVLDIENQLLQVKTQVAMALADQHVLEKKRVEQESAVAEWKRRAELAVGKGDDELARAALERSLSHGRLLEAFGAQLADQSAEAEALRSTYLKLQRKLVDTRGECELLLTRHRRARVLSEAGAQRLRENAKPSRAAAPRVLARMQSRVQDATMRGRALDKVARESSLEERLAQMEKDEQVEQLLAELKAQQRLLPTA